MHKKLLKKLSKGRLLLFILPLLVLAGSAFTFSLVRNLPDAARMNERSVIESTKIYDRTGTVLLYEIHGEEKRTIIPFSEIPDSVKWATLAAEDSNFYKHGALDFRGIARALFVNLARGDITQGGSTITQQLVKKSILTDERTFTRKIKEVFLAFFVEKKYSKDEILHLYLNQVPYGSNTYGVEAAAQTYFAKPARDLTTPEAAILASLLKGPSYYSPYGSHKDELLARKDSILDRMASAGFIKKDEAEKAKKTVLDFAPPKHSIRAPHFVFYIKEILSEKYGEEFVEQGGLKVITSLDWRLQEEAERLIREGAEENEKLVAADNASLVSVDPKTGDILAMVGSRDYWEKPRPEGCKPGVNCKFDPHVNITLRSRQPGSAFKPFVYATAFKKGYTPDTVLFDTFTEFNASCDSDGTPSPGLKIKDCYHPHNYDGKFRGPVSLRQALAQSLNIPSVKLLYLAGIKDSIETAASMGITTVTDFDRYGLTLVLGGAEVNLLEMTSAFGVFAQDGIRHPTAGILRIENSQGVILEEKKEESFPAIDTNIARTINDILSDNDARVPVFNPRSSLYFPDRRVAAKTGTTQDYRDAWVVGYTPSVATGVWVGNNDNSQMNQAGLSIMVAGPLWHKFMNFALSQTPPEDFPAFDPPRPEKLALRGIYRSGPVIKIDTISKKLATPSTPEDLVEERSYGDVRSILYFVNKNDPLGPIPANSDDPQYRNWQTAIDRWLAANQLQAGSPPQEYDNLHTPDKKPKIEVISVSEKEIRVRVSYTFPLKEISLFINDELIDGKTGPLVSPVITFSLKEAIAAGSSQIKITAYDAVGNKESATKEFINP